MTKYELNVRYGDNSNDSRTKPNQFFVVLIAILGWSPPEWFRNQLFVVFKAMLGWSPPEWFRVSDLNYSKNGLKGFMTGIIVFFFFIIDISDAIVDLLLGFDSVVNGSKGEGTLGVWLVIATIVGRVLAAIHATKFKTEDRQEQTFVYILMEMSVFMVEDGAAIIFLAMNPEDGLLNTLSSWLSLICGCCFIVYILHQWVINNESMTIGLIIIYLLLITGPVFLIIILLTQVLLKDSDDDDNDFSGPLKIASFVIYGIGSFVTMAFFIVGVIATGTSSSLSYSNERSTSKRCG